jgi:exonuclease SbcC
MLKTLGTIADKSIEQLNCEKTNLKVKVQKLQLTHQELTDSIALCEKLKQNIQTKIEAQKQLNVQVKINNEAVIAKQASLQQIKSQIPSIYQESGVVEQSISSVNSEIEILSSNLNLARSQLGQVKSDFDKTETQKISLENQVKSESKSKQLIDESWLVALKNSQFDSQAMFKEAILDEDTQQKMEKNITEYRQHIENLSAVIIQLEQDLCDQKEPDLIALENMLNQEKDELKSYESTWRKLDERHNLLRHVQILLAEAHKQNESLETQYNTIGTLYEVSNGLTGKKISLQRFVLSVLLDDVLIQASVRLSIMSKGRYQLVRKSDRAKGNKASGLELEVDDAYTGKIRSVATLSGGESFLAALSLALGVSDVVQSYAGGVKLEALFIDEGFGSLDADALELTIRALIDLQSSGRMIGIISHVTELKEQMALRVDVTAGKFGSEISILNQEH